MNVVVVPRPEASRSFEMPPQRVNSPVPKDEKLDIAQPNSPLDEPQRGRKKAREDDDDDEAYGSDNDVQRNGVRKRKRSRKALDKKYPCPQEGCGKSYSRAEHLYRHQLNHTPKQIYYRDFPDCCRQFVRQDLCARHKERHTTKGSNLQRKDNYITKALVDQLPKIPSLTNNGDVNDAGINPFHQPAYDTSPNIIQSPTETMGPPRNNLKTNGGYQEPSFQTPTTPYRHGQRRTNSDGQYHSDGTATGHISRIPYSLPQRHGSLGSMDGMLQRSATMPHAETTAPEGMQWNNQTRINITQQNHTTGYQGYIQYPTVSGMTTMYAQAQNGGYHMPQYYNTPQDYITRNLSGDSMGTTTQGDSPLNDQAYPVFEEEMYGRSPSMIPEKFTSWLLDENNSSGQHNHHGMNDLTLDPVLQASFAGLPTTPLQTTVSVNSLLEPTARMAILSEAKRLEITDIIEKRFIGADNSPVLREREQLLFGDWNAETHVLSRQAMQRYIGSYWYHFHDQMPILHRPTFSADKCQNLLLIAILAIGAANLDKIHDQGVVTAAADLANFLAWHLRGKLFEDKDFPPPTKLWVLQSLILLECYEKLYSSRSLHERSTIHHATTISLLRRGSILLGRSAMDSPTGEEDKQSMPETSDPWWNHWITFEATKRVAYALFIIDSTHAMMFGHTTVMVAHEMRLPLPCDEALWMANSGMEVGRLEQSLRNEGIRPISFADGLKWTLNGKPVRTNRFGRTAIMAGLLNVTFHLKQRDIQIRSLGVIGGKEPVWKISLTKAFDIWEGDWENDHEAAATSVPPNRHVRDSSHSSSYSTSTIDEEHTFESRVVLHHLAHMGMHIDVVQCQVYAKAKRLLGRTITPHDYSTCAKRMKDWAGRASARDAVYYSLKFLGAVLAPDLLKGVSAQQKPPPFRPSSGEYVPRDDYLLNRPWVVYFAALVVWSYGYALDGPLKASANATLETKEEQVRDMRSFLSRVGAVAGPNELMELAGKRNGCAGLLCFLSAQFKNSRWELMREASVLLNNCVDMLRGGGIGQGIA